MVIMGIYSFIRLVLIRGTQTVFDFIYFGNQHYGGKKLGTAQANARSSEGCSKIFRSSAGDSATLRQRANQLSIGGPCRHMFVIVVFFSLICVVFFALLKKISLTRWQLRYGGKELAYRALHASIRSVQNRS